MKDPTAASVAQDAINKLSTAVEAIAEKTGEMAPRAWEVAVQRQATEGWVDAVVFSMLLTAIAALFVVVVVKTKVMHDGANRAMMLSIAAWLMMMVVVPCWFYARDGVYHLLNPEYYAAMEMLRVLR